MENNNTQIRGIESLRQRKRELQLEMKITRQALLHSLRRTGYESKRTFINSVLIPLGIGSLASLIFSQKNQSGEKPDWLLFAEQAVHTVSSFFEQTPAEDGQQE